MSMFDEPSTSAPAPPSGSRQAAGAGKAAKPHKSGSQGEEHRVFEVV